MLIPCGSTPYNMTWQIKQLCSIHRTGLGSCQATRPTMLGSCCSREGCSISLAPVPSCERSCSTSHCTGKGRQGRGRAERQQGRRSRRIRLDIREWGSLAMSPGTEDQFDRECKSVGAPTTALRISHLVTNFVLERLPATNQPTSHSVRPSPQSSGIGNTYTRTYGS